ncbi:hypothetical protein VdG1_00970 [Verticillium dahliae VDG1]|nr:hypothetical protein VdG1_00970 [Verticillium dahliae VDG1]
MLRVVAPAAPAVMFDAGKPATWSNEQLRAWVGKNILAPSESGAQLLRLLAAEFLTRCLRSPGVTDDQARAFQAKFWRLHRMVAEVLLEYDVATRYYYETL